MIIKIRTLGNINRCHYEAFFAINCAGTTGVSVFNVSSYHAMDSWVRIRTPPPSCIFLLKYLFLIAWYLGTKVFVFHQHRFCRQTMRGFTSSTILSISSFWYWCPDNSTASHAHTLDYRSSLLIRSKAPEEPSTSLPLSAFASLLFSISQIIRASLSIFSMISNLSLPSLILSSPRVSACPFLLYAFFCESSLSCLLTLSPLFRALLLRFLCHLYVSIRCSLVTYCKVSLSCHFSAYLLLILDAAYFLFLNLFRAVTIFGSMLRPTMITIRYTLFTFCTFMISNTQPSPIFISTPLYVGILLTLRIEQWFPFVRVYLYTCPFSWYIYVAWKLNLRKRNHKCTCVSILSFFSKRLVLHCRYCSPVWDFKTSSIRDIELIYIH